ncbi:MAG: ribosome recycling factor [Patescibacteria group bacterium]
MKEKFEKIIQHLHGVLAELRTGRASPVLVENLQVESYGAMMPLKSVAAISTPEARQIVIKPWDKGMMIPIQKAIQSSNVGMNPIVDQDSIRLAIPPLTEERRKELVKTAKQRMEEARIAIRRVREDEMKDIEHKEKDGEISETEKFKQRDAVQKVVDEYNKKVDDIGREKEKEIMTI